MTDELPESRHGLMHRFAVVAVLLFVSAPAGMFFGLTIDSMREAVALANAAAEGAPGGVGREERARAATRDALTGIVLTFLFLSMHLLLTRLAVKRGRDGLLAVSGTTWVALLWATFVVSLGVTVFS